MRPLAVSLQSRAEQVAANVPKRFLEPVLDKISHTAVRSHPRALAKWLHASGPTLRLGKQNVEGVNAEQWLRVLRCLKKAPHITELHVWGGSDDLVYKPWYAWEHAIEHLSRDDNRFRRGPHYDEPNYDVDGFNVRVFSSFPFVSSVTFAGNCAATAMH